MSDKITLMLVDDHAIVREGYRSLLQKQPRFEIVSEVSDGDSAYTEYQQKKPDVSVMDLSLPGQSGLKVIERIRHFDSNACILVFTMHQNPRLAIQATRAGALGYISKSSTPDVLIRGIFQVANNTRTFSSDIAHTLALEKLKHEKHILDKLTYREYEILQLLLAAKPNQEIAEILNISPKTVSNSHYNIKKKLKVNNDIELTRLAIQLRLINLLELTSESPDNIIQIV